LLHIKLLGFVQVFRDGHLVPLRANKRLALLAALALNCNEPVSLENLSRALWGDKPPRSAVANLRNYARDLRRAVDDRIITVTGGYQLSLQPGERDVDEFRHQAERGQTALAAGDPAAAVTALSAALALWRGPAGQGLRMDTALDVELTSLDDERLVVFDALVEARLNLDQHDALVPILRKHLYHHPLRERSWAQLMLAQYRAGSAATALATYAEARSVIRDELGIEPDPQLTDLHRAILNRSPALLPKKTATRNFGLNIGQATRLN
jgi:DNA-binding SARP family transcriptional activator